MGFQARSVVGGVFLPLLADAASWKKWASRDRLNQAKKPLVWAALPEPPGVTMVIPTSENEGGLWHYTFDMPTTGWSDATFDDAPWKQSPGGFGREGTSGAVVRTVWNNSDIWMRRTFTMPNISPVCLTLRVAHDEDAEIYINGVLAQCLTGFNTSYESYAFSNEALAKLLPGQKITFAVHCHQTTGGQGIDIGIVKITPATQKIPK